MAPLRQPKLGAFLMAPGHHVAAWRRPEAHADLCADFEAYVRITQAAEAAEFDPTFLDYTLAGKDTDPATGRFSARSAFFEPITQVAGIAAVTERIGLAGTVSTPFDEGRTVRENFGLHCPVARRSVPAEAAE